MAELHPRQLLLTADTRLVNNVTENEQQGTGATRKSRRDARICCPIAWELWEVWLRTASGCVVEMKLLYTQEVGLTGLC